MFLRFLVCGVLGVTMMGSLYAAGTVRTVSAEWTSTAPVIDGDCGDPVWRTAPGIQVVDKLANIPIEVSFLYDTNQIYLCTRFPDAEEDRLHKAYLWDANSMRYRTGPAREDTIVLKWAIEAGTNDLTLQAEKSYRADVWYWKANRTDPAGYADDKLQIYSTGNMPQATQLLSHTGQPFYLRRSGDEGTATYQTQAYAEFMGPTMPKYAIQLPSGSRADIHAKGHWKDGFWSVEFARQLQTGYGDDVQFKPGNSYLFGVSRYEIAGRQPNKSTDQPYFGAGEIHEHLRLRFLMTSKP